MVFKSFLVAVVHLASLFAFAQSGSDVVEANDETRLTIEQESKKDASEIEDARDTTPQSKGVEKIEVTGSYVRRIDIEGPSPVVTIDQQDFEVAGVDTITDYLRESPMFSSATDSGNRDGYFNFRGQHAGSTLVLINGMRVPKLGGDDRGFYSGVENIPTNVIERVEVLKDGSSALYGSDAMAGVMNFITKKDYDGAEYSTRVNVPEMGEGLQQNHSIAFGKSYARGNWFASTQYVEQRGYTEENIDNHHTEPTFSNLSDKTFTPGTFNAKGEFVPGDTVFVRGDCQAESDRDCNRNDTRNQDFVRDPRQNLGTLLTGRYDVTNDISVSMVGLYNRRQRKDYGQPYFVNFTSQNDQELFSPSVFQGSSLSQAVAGADAVEATLRPNQEVGSRDVAILQNAYSAQAKVEGFYLDTWKWDLSGSYAYSIEERDHRNGLIDMGIASDIMSSQAWSAGGINTNAFQPANVQGTEGYEASMTTARLLTTGELFDMNSLYGTGGPVSMAFGVEGQWESTADLHDEELINRNLNVDFFPNQEGIRTVNSAFMEIVAYPLNSVEIQIAGRSDTYSDFGTTFNPKVSVGYRPSNKILLRSSWGTNFNAPSVRNMIQRDYVEYQEVRICPPEVEDCQGVPIPVTRYRDPTLRPEEGVNYNFGTVIQPNRNWTFTFDQWNFEGEGMLAKRSGNDYSSLYDALGGDFDALESESGVSFQTNSNGDVVSGRFPAVRNMGTRIIRGIDFNVDFKSPVRLMGRVLKMGVNFDHTHMLERRTKYTEFSDFRNYQDMEWKNRTSVYMSTRRHNYRLAARTIAGDTGNRSQTRGQTVYDFNYTYQIPLWTARVSFGVKNLLNSKLNVDRSQNFIDYTRGFNSSEIQALGRRYYVGYSHSF